MIRIENVRKSFNRHRANEIKAIDNTSIELAEKGLVTFLGHSGCGKTTLLNAIGGLDKVDSGKIYVNGERITRRTSAKKDSIRNLNIGYIFQNYNLIEDATVYDNVSLVLKMVGFKDKKAIERRVMYVLESVGIARYRNRPAKTLSGGERQRVGIARAIVKNPRIIIADEPTGNLDSKNTIEIMNIIKSISKETLVILVTHERSIAEFYADRIVEIVDGKIVEDKENAHEGNLDYRIDTKIYLKDMPYQSDLSKNGLDVHLYSDNPERPPRINIVIKNGNLYIDTSNSLSVGHDGFEVIDAHYEGLSKDVYEEYAFDYDDYYKNAETIEGVGDTKTPKKAKYKSPYGVFRAIGLGFGKLHSYSKLKKILLIGFIIASMFVIYSLSNIAGVINVTDEKFTTTNKNYITLNTGKTTIEQYNEYVSMEGVKLVIPGTGEITFTMKLDDYLQSMRTAVGINGIISGTSELKTGNLIAGRLPNSPNELVIDKKTVKSLLKESWSANEVGLSKPEDLVGRKLILKNYMDNYTIVGISDCQTPCIYVEDSEIMKIVQNGSSKGELEVDINATTVSSKVYAWSTFANNPSITIVKGEAPDEDYEVLVPESMMDQVGIGYNTDVKLNGNNLYVSGYYHDEHQGGGFFANDNTALINLLYEKENLTIKAENKDDMIVRLSDGNFTVVDNYAEAREVYEAQNANRIFRTILVAAVMVLVSLIEIYLMLRASFLSRVKEVGVLRAIGLKKWDIYKMFAGEVLAITIVTAVPGIALMGYILSSVIKASEFVADMYQINTLVVGGSFAIVLVFNFIAGLIPVFMTLRKTPAAILARNDVN